MKTLKIIVVLAITIGLYRFITQEYAVRPADLLPLCSGQPFSLYDIVELAVLVVTVRAVRALVARREA